MQVNKCVLCGADIDKFTSTFTPEHRIRIESRVNLGNGVVSRELSGRVCGVCAYQSASIEAALQVAGRPLPLWRQLFNVLRPQ